MNTNLPTDNPAEKREKIILIVLVIAIAVAIGLYFLWPKNQATNEAGNQTTASSANKYNIPTITAQELKDKLDNQEKFILLDVRKPVEYAEGHVNGAANIPLADLESSKKYFPTDIDIVTMCDGSNCQRSQAAAEQLTDWGFKRVKNFKGGIKEWKQEAYPVIIGLVSNVQNFKIPTITAAELNSRIKAGAINTILDVRNSVDYGQQHIPKARNVSFAEVEALAKSQDINLELPIVIYGGANDVSTMTAARTLLANGAKDLSVLDGNFDAWLAGNYPTSNKPNE